MGDKELSIPKFDGDYEHWAMLMENMLKSKEWWDLIETGISRPERNVILTGPQRTELAEMNLKDLKVKNYLFAAIDKTILKTIAKKDSSKDIWDSMKTKYQGNLRVQSAQLQRLRRSFEILEMREEDTITEYFSRVMVVANDMRGLGEDMPDAKVVEKILRTLTDRFTYVVCAIEESKDIKNLSVDELQASLLVHEQNMRKPMREEHALKVEGLGRSRGGYPGRGGTYQTRGGYSGRGGRGRGEFDKSKIECFKCHRMGHFKNECPTWEKNANYAELEEDVLLMAYTELNKAEDEHVWFLDSGCSNHMCGHKAWFTEFDHRFRQNVKLGDNRRMVVEGKGNLLLKINGLIQVISSVYYVPGLKNNLLSVGQLQQKGLRITIEDNTCEIWHKEQQRVIMHSSMSTNRMFVIFAVVVEKKKEMKAKCLQTTVEKMESMWHKRYGHLSHKGLQMLGEKEMVIGLPQIKEKEGVCEICMKGKQIRANIPKQSDWRASRRLELVHSDICGPISPASEGGKRYIINFIDDYSRKCWTYFLTEKSEAFNKFKEFRMEAERETGELLVCLRTDRGGEYNSRTFQDYCTEHGIKRQLTTAYTPQQNGVAERKNRSVLNMTRCMMMGMNVPQRFWPEAVQYSVYILNRSPTSILGNITPTEKWNNHKPSVDHLRVFGCVAFALIPYEKRIKLDEKSIKCVMFGVSRESKAYRLYDPTTKKIITSKDVAFDENKGWNWDESVENREIPWDVMFGDDEEAAQDHNNGEAGEENGAPEQNDEPDDQEGNEEITPQEVPTINTDCALPRDERNRRRPAWLKDYQCEGMSLFIEECGDEMVAMLFAEDDPVKFDEAVKHERWRKAMEAEIKSIEDNNTWELVELPVNAKVIGVKWVFKTKFNEKGDVDKFKARLVAKGFHQTQGVDFYEVFAPVARWDTIRLILGAAARKRWNVFQLDVKSAFLHGDLQEDVYVDQPPGFETLDEIDKVYKLKKALYGLRQAPRAWYSKIEGYFQRKGFNKCYCEHTLFVKAEKEGILIVSLYVDDLIYTGNSEEMLEEFKASMKDEFSMTDLGRMKYFLGIEVIQDEEGIFIGQKKYAEDILEKFGMASCNFVKNPMVPGQKLSKEGYGPPVDATMFKQMVGSLRYLTATRPDLIYSVNLVSRYMEKPTEQHLLAVKRILRYVRGTTGYGIQYKCEGDVKLVGYADSDYAGDVDDRKSTSGYVFMFGGAAVSWASKKQPIVTLSTTEAEFVAAANGACQAVWLRNVLEGTGMEQTESTVMFCDNSSTIKLSRNPVLHGRSKHIHVRYHFLRELVNDGVINLEYCPTRDQFADIMTKAVTLETFERLRGSLGVCPKEG